MNTSCTSNPSQKGSLMSHIGKRRLSPARGLALTLIGAAAVTALVALAEPAHAAPSISITKQLVGGSPAPTPADARAYPAGSSQTWQYVITNTGTEAVYNPRVTDDQNVPVTGCPVRLEVGQSGACTGTGTIGTGFYGVPLTAPTVPAATLPGATIDSFYTQALPRTGAPAPQLKIASGSLPAGLSMDRSGVITGTPLTPGTASFTVTASNAAGSASRAFSIVTRDVAPAINSMSLPNPTAGKAYSEQVVATGNRITWSVSAGALPTGLSLNASTGVIAGTPSTDGSSTFTLQASNSGGTVTRAFTLVVQTAAPTMSNTTMAEARYGASYSQQVPGIGKNLSYRVVSGGLPAGFSMSTTGLITGTSAVPWTTTAGQRGSFSVEASNAAGSAVATMNFLAYPAAPPAMSYSTNQARSVTYTGAGSSTMAEICLPNTTIDLTGVKITASNGGTLVDKSVFGLKCASGNILTKGVTAAGTHVFTLVRENITLRREFTMTVTVSR